MSELKVNKISPASGTAFALGDSGDTFTVPSGATIVNSGTATGFGDNPGIVQVKQFRKLSTINYGDTSDTVLPAPFGGTATITPSAAANYIRCEYYVNVDHGAQWRSGYIKMQWSTNASTYYGLSGGATSTGDGAARHGNSMTLGGMFHPNVTTAVNVRLVINGHASGSPLRYGQYNNEGEDNTNTTPDTENGVIAVGHYLILTEITGSYCSTADTA
tara:strand:+ start:243 stop:893 length:651 start_codon:yes stop_codon:yes gene_type:complete